MPDLQEKKKTAETSDRGPLESEDNPRQWVEDGNWWKYGQHLKTWVTHRIPLLAVPTVSVVSKVVVTMTI